jgi:hypothetical protein
MTIRILVIFVLTFACSAAENSRNSADPKSAVPKEATLVSPGVYRHVDSAGKAWIYRQTPFGFSKSAEEDATRNRDVRASEGHGRITPFGESTATPQTTPPPAENGKRATPFGDVPATGSGAEKTSGSAPAITNAVEAGDSIRFERPSAFGTYKWTRKKTELTEDEKRAWEASRKSGGSSTGQSK